jgi:hypothetical protein
LGQQVGLQDRWLKRILRHAISEFSKKGLGPDYYGYHNIDHELEAAYFTLMAGNGQQTESLSFAREELTYLFVAALFHDYDPQKRFDKPHEDAIERIVRSDKKIVRFIEDAGLDINLVIVLIYRTAYPFKGEIAEHARARMNELFDAAGIPASDVVLRKRYSDMGWFLSVSERIAGYALGDFYRAMDLARRNAHALGWHPSVINERSVQYFTYLKEEKAMYDWVMGGVPEEQRRTFLSNVESFRKAWLEELEVKSLLSNNVKMMALVYGDPETRWVNDGQSQDMIRDSVLGIYREQALPIRVEEDAFRQEMFESYNILVTLAAYGSNGDARIVGYARGYPLEKSRLRRGTLDENIGMNNTAYLEGIGVVKGFWGASGGHLLRMRFLREASRRGYRYVTGYAHREVILQRMKRGEKISIVQEYNPDMLDYYRVDLNDSLQQTILEGSESAFFGRR